MRKFALILVSLVVFSCNSTAQDKKATTETKNTNMAKKEFPVTKTEAEWKAQLTPLEFNVLRKEATEPPFSSDLNKVYAAGTYVCAACNTPVFEGKYKFDSGTGWPSFDREIEGNVAFSTDSKLGYSRTEEHCATCGGHLGHVFNDGPAETTGERHCINGVALNFIPEKNE